jgi:hypothetical protein
VVLIGAASHAGVWTRQFYSDNVDWFASTCEAIEEGTLWETWWSPANGHISLLPKLGHYAVWRWCGRYVLVWHALTMVLWAAALAGIACLCQRMFQSRAVTLAVLAVAATSRAYAEQLLPPCTNHLWAASAAVWSVWAAWRFAEEGGAGRLALAAILGLASYLCVATGVLAFVFMAALAVCGPRTMTRKRRAALWAAGTFGAAALAFVQKQIGGVEQPLNLSFGLQQTAAGLYQLAGKLIGPPDLSRVLAVVPLAGLVLARRKLTAAPLWLGAGLMCAPMLLAFSFRGVDPGIGSSTRFGFLPLIGACLWLGEALRHARAVKWRPRGAMRRAVLAVFVAASVGIVTYGACKSLEPGPGGDSARRQHRLERELGDAVAQYAASRGRHRVELPRRPICLPAYPTALPLDYVARYCVPAHLGVSVAGSDANRDFDAFLRQHAPDVAEMLGDVP